MPTPLKPPRGAFIATSILYHPELKPAVKDTLIQLIGLAWRSNGCETPPLSYNQLAHITGKPVKTLYGHIAILRDTHAALRMQDAGDGAMIFSFTDWARPARSGRAAVSEKPEMPVKEEEQDIINSDSSENNLLLHQAGANSAKRLYPRLKKPPAVRTALSDGLQNSLVEAGLFPSLLLEVENSGRAEDDLTALLAWASRDQPDNPAPLFVARLRAGAKAPAAYQLKSCPHCGQRGSHDELCPYRYLDDTYAQFIRH